MLKYAQQARLQDVSPHTLRHTFGKSALDAGVDLVTVSRLMGHERLETTAIYTTPSAQDLEHAVEKLEPDYINEKPGSGGGPPHLARLCPPAPQPQSR